MCLLLIANNTHKNYKLIIAANRDEFYKRPAQPAHFWREHPQLLAGKDLKEGGTWMGITKGGRFAAITNYRDMKNQRDEAPTRGKIVTDFLLSEILPVEYARELTEKGDQYNGFNLVFGEINNLYYFSNQTNKVIHLENKIYGLSNHLLDTAWHKVAQSKNSFKQKISEDEISEEELFEILFDETAAPDDLLPETGIGLELERAVSPVFIKTESYGTRSSTIVFVDEDDNVSFVEKSLNIETNKWETNRFNFKIEKKEN